MGCVFAQSILRFKGLFLFILGKNNGIMNQWYKLRSVKHEFKQTDKL